MSHSSVYSSDTHVVFKHTSNVGMLHHTWCIWHQPRRRLVHHVPDG